MTNYLTQLYHNGVGYDICGGGGGITVEPNVELLVVGGGGAGGGGTSTVPGGGGGAGGVIQCCNYQLSCSSYNVVIGVGGTGRCNVYGCNGGDSCFGDLVACGGGGGGRNSYGCLGGSGGGHAMLPSCVTGLENCVYQQGHKGGIMSVECNQYSGGGGGGAYNDGRPSTYYLRQCTNCGGKGGDGILTYISGAAYRYGAGGGGGSFYKFQYGGAGGGGMGGCSSAGYDASGYGSGGGGAGGSGLISGSGSQGIVIARYKTDGSMGINCATGGTVYCCDGYTIHCFTSNGTFTIVS